jgi:hypothetical protein
MYATVCHIPQMKNGRSPNRKASNAPENFYMPTFAAIWLKVGSKIRILYRRNCESSALLFWYLALTAILWMGVVTDFSAEIKIKTNPRDGLSYAWIPPAEFSNGLYPE